MSSLPTIMHRSFDEVRHDLEDVVAKIRTVFDPRLRQKHLRKLRELLEEADEIISEQA